MVWFSSLFCEAKSKVVFWVKCKVLHELPCSSARHIKALRHNEALQDRAMLERTKEEQGGKRSGGTRMWNICPAGFRKAGELDVQLVFFFSLFSFDKVLCYLHLWQPFDISYPTNAPNTRLAHNLLLWFSDVPATLITGAFKQLCLQLQLCWHREWFCAVPEINQRKWLLMVNNFLCS